ncbi:hypothetical protein ABZ957_32455 [Streptomyces sp. NPDC046316]|uniref:hypothetical protein n=1 Tax=Streptomyces sp. NPDC046316 TaxID=3154494 RepID=UPI0033DFDAC7
MVKKSKARGRTSALGASGVALAVLTACAGPFQYYEGTGLHDATVAELAGKWENIEETRLTLRRDGTAAFQQLDGENFDFEEGWRLSGTGTWELTDDADGQDVRVVMTTRTGIKTRVPTTATATATATEPPATYSWRFYVRRDPDAALELFFFYGDPDIGNTYVMKRGATH